MIQTKTKQKPVVDFSPMGDSLLYRGQVIGSVADQAVTLDIREASLVRRGFARKRAIMLYRALPRIYRYLKSQGYVVYGGVWFPNLEKETLGAFFDAAVAEVNDDVQETTGQDSLERES
jgi:hypothetical protein